MAVLKILAFVFLVPGIAAVLGAKWIVERYGLDRHAKCEYEDELSEEELKQYKQNKAVVNLKMLGMLTALPGFVFMVIALR